MRNMKKQVENVLNFISRILVYSATRNVKRRGITKPNTLGKHSIIDFIEPMPSTNKKLPAYLYGNR